MNDLKTYKCPPMFRYCDFADTTMPDGTLLTAELHPIALNNGNVVFPIEWSKSQREAYRLAHDLMPT